MSLNESPDAVPNTLDRVLLANTIRACLEQSETFGVKCADLQTKIVDVVTQWFEEKQDELADDFTIMYPQTRPAKQQLLDRMNNEAVFPLDRIPKDVLHPAFRRTKLVDHWIGEIYYRVLQPTFSS